MAQVVLSNELCRQFAGGQTHFEVDAVNVRKLIRTLDEMFPGLGAELESDGIAIAIDGEIFSDPFLETIADNSEVYFLPAIKGG